MKLTRRLSIDPLSGVRGHERHVVKVLSESWLVFVLSEAVRHHERCVLDRLTGQ
jgi:hypothetical protein